MRKGRCTLEAQRVSFSGTGQQQGVSAGAWERAPESVKGKAAQAVPR
jgi:hypothetical protein